MTISVLSKEPDPSPENDPLFQGLNELQQEILCLVPDLQNEFIVMGALTGGQINEALRDGIGTYRERLLLILETIIKGLVSKGEEHAALQLVWRIEEVLTSPKLKLLNHREIRLLNSFTATRLGNTPKEKPLSETVGQLFEIIKFRIESGVCPQGPLEAYHDLLVILGLVDNDAEVLYKFFGGDFFRENGVNGLVSWEIRNPQADLFVNICIALILGIPVEALPTTSANYPEFLHTLYLASQELVMQNYRFDSPVPNLPDIQEKARTL